ncbi:MAG TPA: methyltransferase domain-containing protein [Gammaproteobacteria bacterium]|nr:methyltransferase domain-containing protein [Gammaproteobacteria bacterium]
MPRRVRPELLDELPPDDPRAVRSRRDLRVVNRIMGTRSLLLRAMDAALDAPPRTIVELGAGDGRLLLALAAKRARRWPGTHAVLLDLQPVVTPDTPAAFRELGWSAEVIEADVLDWLASRDAGEPDVVVANLFVHHFEGERLERLLAGIAAHTRAFVCCEPRRGWWPLAGSHLLGLIGCNEITRHDAVLSVHAGFRGDELSAAWRRALPGGAGAWRLREHAAGAFSHVFTATRA